MEFGLFIGNLDEDFCDLQIYMSSIIEFVVFISNSNCIRAVGPMLRISHRSLIPLNKKNLAAGIKARKIFTVSEKFSQAPASTVKIRVEKHRGFLLLSPARQLRFGSTTPSFVVRL